MELTSRNEEVLVNDGSVCVACESDGEEGDDGQVVKFTQRKITAKNYNSCEAQYLTLFTCGTKCHHAVADEFFGNK